MVNNSVTKELNTPRSMDLSRHGLSHAIAASVDTVKVSTVPVSYKKEQINVHTGRKGVAPKLRLTKRERLALELKEKNNSRKKDSLSARKREHKVEVQGQFKYSQHQIDGLPAHRRRELHLLTTEELERREIERLNKIAEEEKLAEEAKIAMEEKLLSDLEEEASKVEEIWYDDGDYTPNDSRYDEFSDMFSASVLEKIASVPIDSIIINKGDESKNVLAGVEEGTIEEAVIRAQIEKNKPLSKLGDHHRGKQDVKRTYKKDLRKNLGLAFVPELKKGTPEILTKELTFTLPTDELSARQRKREMRAVFKPQLGEGLGYLVNQATARRQAAMEAIMASEGISEAEYLGRLKAQLRSRQAKKRARRTEQKVKTRTRALLMEKTREQYFVEQKYTAGEDEKKIVIKKYRYHARDRRREKKAEKLENQQKRAARIAHTARVKKTRRERRKQERKEAAMREPAPAQLHTENGFLLEPPNYNLSDGEEIEDDTYTKFDDVARMANEKFDRLCRQMAEGAAMVTKAASRFSDFIPEQTRLLFSRCDEYAGFLMAGVQWLHLCFTIDEGRIFSVTSLFVGNFCKGIIKIVSIAKLSEMIVSFVRSLLPQQKQQLVTESWSEDIKCGLNMYKSLVNSDVAQFFRRILMLISMGNFLPESWSTYIDSFIGKAKKMSFYDLILDVIDKAASMLAVGEALFAGVPFIKALLSEDPVSAALMRVDELMLYADKNYVGLPCPGWIHRGELVDELDKILPFLDVSMSKLSPVTTRYREINSARLKVIGLVSSLKSQLRSGTRIAPILVLVHGPPRIGKSNVGEFCFKLLSDVMGRKHSQDLVYTRVLTSEYWDGYNSYSQPYIYVPELGATKVQSNGMGDTEPIKEITSLVSSMPVSLNYAFGEGNKGKTPFLGELIVADTNHKDLDLSKFLNNEAAVRARILYVRPTPLPQYRVEGCEAIDPKKCNDKVPHMSRWTYTVHVEKALDAVRSQPEVLLDNGDADQFATFMRKHYRAHFLKEKKIITDMQWSMENDVYGEYVGMPTENGLILDDVKLDTESGFLKAYASQQFESIKQTFRSAGEYKWSYFRDDIKEWHITLEFVATLIVNIVAGWFMAELTDLVRKFLQKDPASVPLFRMTLMRLFVFLLSAAMGGFIHHPLITLCSLLGIVFSFVDFRGVAHFLMQDEMDQRLFRLRQKVSYNSRLLREYLGFVGLKTSFVPPTHVSFMSALGVAIAGGAVYMAWSSVFKQGKKKAFRRDDAHADNLKGQKIKPRFLFYDNLENKHVVEEEVCDTRKIYREPKEGEVEELLATPHGLKQADLATEATVFHRGDAELNAALNSYEEKCETGRSFERVLGRMDGVWNDKIRVSKSPAHTSSVEDLWAYVSSNVRFTEVHVQGENPMVTHILGICDNFAIMHAHAVDMSRRVVLNVSVSCGPDPKNGYAATLLTSDRITLLGDDLLLVRLSGTRFKPILNHIFDGEFLHSRGFIDGTYIGLSYDKNGYTALDKLHGHIVVSSAISYRWREHAKGKCGIPVLISVGNGWSIAGIHSAGSHDVADDYCCAIPLPLAKIKAAMDGFTGFRVMSESGNLVSILSTESLSKQYCDMKYGYNPLPKSPFMHENFHSLGYYGRILGATVLQGRSNLIPSCFGEAPEWMDALFERSFRDPVTVRFMPPKMKPFLDNQGVWRSPYNNALRKMNITKKPLDSTILSKIETELVDRFVCGLRERGVEKLSPLDMDAAINGVIHDAYLRRVDVNKSAGFGYPGKKNVYFEDLVDVKLEDIEVVREAADILKRDVLDAMETYSSGRTCSPIFKAQLKDEPREPEKVALGKTRLFYMTPLPFLVLCKMFLAPFYTSMVAYRDLFCTAVGTNMHKEAHEIYEKLSSFDDEHIFEGDYGGYDLQMPFDISECASRIVYRVLEEMGYNVFALKIVCGILSDNLFPMVEILNDLFVAAGLQPSGKYATAEDNSLKNLILTMYIYYHLGLGQFFRNVLPITYGDDLLMAVKKIIAHVFNMRTFKTVCEDVIGMEFTTAGKQEVTQEFTTLLHMTFLKRNFRHHPELDRIVAPLSVSSMYKMLQWVMPSRSVTMCDQMLSTLTSFLYEAFLHLDESGFNELRNEILLFFAGAHDFKVSDIQDKVPSFGEIFNNLSLCPTDIAVQGGRQHNFGLFEATSRSDLVAESGWEVAGVCEDRRKIVLYGNKGSGLTRFDSNPRVAELQDEKRRLEQLVYDLEQELLAMNCVTPELTRFDCESSANYSTLPDYRMSVEGFFNKKAELEDARASLSVICRILARRRNLHTESGEISDMKAGTVDSAAIVAHENVLDIGGTSEDTTDAGWEMKLNVSDTDLDLNNFFSRPVQLGNLSVDIAADLDYRNDIWQTYLLVPSVRAKLKNFAYLRADLNVRITVSGGPFHMGKILVSFVPMTYINDVSARYKASSSLYRPNLLKWLSQMRGARVMDVRENEPMEITLPYVYPRPVMRLFNSSTAVLSDSTAFSDSTQMGTLFIQTLNPLGTSATVDSPVSVDVYGWLSNVQLAAPTGTLITLTTESGMRDERKEGPVERVASRAAEVSTALTSVPYLRPMAVASSMVLQGISRLAAIYGWSYPVDTTFASRMKNEPFQNAAVTVGMDTGHRLALEPKQELVVDASVGGVLDDELTLAHLCRVESLFTTFTWATTSTPLSTILFDCAVFPIVTSKVTGTVNHYQPTSLAFAARPFQYWSGSITYRLEFVVSNFVRGKVAIIYEPNINQKSLIEGSISLNKQHILIVDLQEASDVEFCINWCQPRLWNSLTPTSSAAMYPIANPQLWDGYANGFFYITPLTKLQNPNGTSIYVNVYVKSEDMRLNVMTGDFPRNMLQTESGLLNKEVSCFDMNTENLDRSLCPQLHFGEQPLSFRSYLRRFTTNQDLILNADVTTGTKSINLGLLTIPSLQPNTTSAFPGGPVSLFNYLRYAFLGIRGGIRKRVVLSGLPSSSIESVTVGIEPNINATAPYSYVNVGTGLNNMSTVVGVTRFQPQTNQGIEVEIPCYTNSLFLPSGALQPMPVSSTPFDGNYSRLYSLGIQVSGATPQFSVMTDTAIAEDFTFIRYLAAPPYEV